MSARREPSSPPVLPGYEPSRLLGMGGFADVFLYEQQMPRRLVAVKVLLASALGDEVRARFREEADLMARLSHHPSIVTIYHADVAADGRPYLVMEYCARPGLGQRYRADRMGVAEVLRIGVRLASAVETAHRAGILHRDIKPANVLVTDFGWPALTDFGIAATTGWSSSAAVGMSIPWSPPELLAEDPTGDARSDVYSLAATVYSLLARRSPFEVPDGSNTAADLIARIERAPLATTGRGDVPDSLQAVLVRAMDRVPARRHHSALAFARALQQVEAELLLPTTSLDLPERLQDGEPGPSAGGSGSPVDDQATRLRPVRSVSPDVVFPRGASGDPAAQGLAQVQVDEVLERSDDGIPEVWRQHAATVARPGSDSPHGPDGPAGRGRGGRAIAGVVGGLVVVTALVTAGVLVFGPGGAVEQPAVDPPPAPSASVAGLRAVPTPTGLGSSVAADGTEDAIADPAVLFTWSNPEPQDGDRYLWGPVTGGTVAERTLITEPTVSVPVVRQGQELCIEVSIVRADGRASTEPAVACAQT